MRRFTKRLLTGVLSGAMAFSLFPVNGFGTYDAKAAINPALLPQDTESWILPGYGDGIGNWMYQVWDEEEQQNHPTFITGVSVPKEYQGYVVAETEDNDNDGILDNVFFQTDSNMDEEGHTTLSLANEKKESVGMDIPVTVNYRLESGYNGTLTHTIHITDSVYEERVYSSIGADWVLPGQTYEAEIDINHKVALWNDDGWYEHRTVDIENPSYDVRLANPDDDRFTIVPSDGNTFLVKAREMREDEDPEGFFGRAGVNITLYEKGVETHGFWYEVGVDDEFYGLLPDAFTGLKDLKIGEEYKFYPEVKYYNYETAPEGQVVEGVEYDYYDVNEDAISVNKNDDGSYSVIRKNTWETNFGFEANFERLDGKNDPLGRRPWIAELDNSNYITEKDNVFVVFDDAVTRTYTIDRSKLDGFFAPGYELSWKVGRGNWEGNRYVMEKSFTDGFTVSEDGSSVTIDGSQFINNFDVKENEGGRYIDEDSRFKIVVTAKTPGIEDEFVINDAELNFWLGSESYDELVQPWNENWRREETIMPGDVFYLDNYYYFVENNANPKGRYVPFNIQVTGITRYDGDQPDPRNLTNYIEATTVNGRPAIKVIDSIPTGAADSDVFCDYRVDFTYTDASGAEKTGYMMINVTDFMNEAVVSTIGTEGPSEINKDNSGSYTIDTLMGDTAVASLYIVAREYDHETKEVKVSYPQDVMYSFDKHQSDEGTAVKVKDGIYTFTSEINENGGSRISGDFVLQYVHDWTNGDGSSGVSLDEAKTHIEINFSKNHEFNNGLELDGLNTLKTVEWTPSVTSINYIDEEGRYDESDRTGELLYSFVYDPEDVSITANGVEVGDQFVEGPFTFTSKTDKDIKIKIAKADYNKEYGVLRFGGNTNESSAIGTRMDKAHDDHIWSEFEAVKAGIGKAGKVVRVCQVGEETETVAVPAIKSITLNKTVLAYTGANQTVKVTVKDTEGNVIDPIHYTVTNTTKKNAGTYKVVVTFNSYKYEGTKTLTYTIKKPVLKYRAYVQKKNWMSFQTAAVSATADTKTMAGTTDNLRMETIQMQLSGVGGEVRYRAYCQKKGWTGVGTETGGWATTANKNTNAGTKGQSLRVEMIQLQAKGEVSNLYDIYYQAYSEKFGWLAWAGNNEKAGSAGYAYKLEAFRVQLVPKGAKFDKTKGSSKKKSFYDKTKDGANPK